MARELFGKKQVTVREMAGLTRLVFHVPQR